MIGTIAPNGRSGSMVAFILADAAASRLLRDSPVSLFAGIGVVARELDDAGREEVDVSVVRPRRDRSLADLGLRSSFAERALAFEDANRPISLFTISTAALAFASAFASAAFALCSTR